MIPLRIELDGDACAYPQVKTALEGIHMVQGIYTNHHTLTIFVKPDPEIQSSDIILIV